MFFLATLYMLATDGFSCKLDSKIKLSACQLQMSKCSTGLDWVKPNFYPIQVIEEVADYPFKALVADIGGVFGLYLGMTLVSIIEVKIKTDSKVN